MNFEYQSLQNSEIEPRESLFVASPSRKRDKSSAKTLVVLDTRTLERECLAQCLARVETEMSVVGLRSIADLRIEKDDHGRIGAIILNIGSKRPSDEEVAGLISSLVSEFSSAPVIVIADTDEFAQIVKTLEYGAKGYIPSSTTVDVCIEAVHLTLAGGVFVPASSILSMRKTAESEVDVARRATGMFTQRQEQVIHALRRGKANKIIAYELSLRESTVKVHIRNIMKKLKATNRTEVAYKLNELSPS